ncbi:MAG TPA: hypothetical protein VMG08_02440 [Allosphingosinicella sp.]|nr:hypothetical protein [Allosphingosinicella sp.]
MTSKAFAKSIRTMAAAALLASSLSAPAAQAQRSRGDASSASRLSPDRDFLIGTWSDAGDCTTTVVFTPDGGYATADGLQGEWSLSGYVLTLSGEAGATRLTIVPIDRNTMEVIGEDGSHERSTRCAGDLGEVHFDDLRVA